MLLNLTVVVLLAAPFPGANPPPEGASACLAQEDARLHGHFEQVLFELRSADVSHLAADRRAARGRIITALEAYAERGAFPRNTRHPDAWVPYFVDDAGTTCAVAQLMRDTHDVNLSARIATAENNALVREMATEGVAAWAERNGLSVAEVARIQPSYCSCSWDHAFEPLCGDDGESYWNACTLNSCNYPPFGQGTRRDEPIEVAHDGLCSGDYESEAIQTCGEGGPLMGECESEWEWGDDELDGDEDAQDEGCGGAGATPLWLLGVGAVLTLSGPRRRRRRA